MTGEGAFQVMARRKNLARVTRLEFRAATPRELVHVLGSPHLTALEELAVGHCGLGDEAIRLLVSSPVLARLRELDLGWPSDDGGKETANRVGPDGLAVLGASPAVAGLRSLGLRGNRTVGNAGLGALLAAPHLTGLEALDLRSSGLSGAGVRALAESPRSGALRVLRLGGLDAIDDDAVTALAMSLHLRNIEELEIAGARAGACIPVTDAAAHALAASETLVNLNVLRVTHWATLTDAGRAVLADRFGQVIFEDG
jgi:hypothetical protein